MDKHFIRACVGVLLVVALLAFFAVTCGQARAECFDCLTRASEWKDTKFEGRKDKGDIVSCQPAGFQFTASERGFYNVERICDISPAEATALSAEQIDKDGRLVGKKRFKTMTALNLILVIDKVTDQVVSPADAKAAVEADAAKAVELEIKTLAPVVK
jgi:hypothetical protein